MIAGHELRPSCRAGHLVTVATEPAFSKPLIKGRNVKSPSDPEPHTRVSSRISTSTESPIEENRRQVRPRLTSISSRSVISARTGTVHEISTVPASDTLKKYGRLRSSS